MRSLQTSTSRQGALGSVSHVDARLSRPAPRSAAGRGSWQLQAVQQLEARASAASTSATTTGRILSTDTAKAAAKPQALRNIVYVTSEAAPWSKTGGLGDVSGSLPVALAARGHRVMVVTPRYADYPEGTKLAHKVNILGVEVGYYHYADKGVDWLFVDHPSYPRPGGIYADAAGAYGDNQFRFKLLCLAALEAPLQLSLGKRGVYGDDCVFVANDWHAALVPVYLAGKYRPGGVYKDARCILSIHNLRHQGVFPPTSFRELGLPQEWYGALDYQYPPEMRQGSWAEEGRSVNHMKAGIATADRIMTVSPGYAEEIKTYLGGWGMESLLASRSFVLNGVVNGIDMDEWNPKIDKALAVNYDINSMVRGKRGNKTALQKELGLPVDADIPMVAFIGRLDFQKGADLVVEVAPWLVAQGVQLVCLGTGTKDLENGLRWLENTYPSSARGWVGFNVAMSHKITAAADILLMPSRFEPCGLNQLYAMRYGTIPVAHATGGLKDTVTDFDPWAKAGTGWTFQNCDAQGLQHACALALQTLRNHPADFLEIQKRGMEQDMSWNKAAMQYEQVFEWAKVDPPYCK